ncbi:MAG: Thioredoxin reductase [Candidatus Woesebacteria bacterium GW2011_GWA1_39_21]|uniref:Thioredoxin reductase n=1 Tax=Candidatus Woesebacteria bacterium GW2011_GWA1_39_21 TaxID=1618550 RepID=A0A0G0QND1_9BACT|nr:MAG: Thioredoxin reductase [Candidatus Woesebacteria bacterium GW2011_GWA1_39_21]
MSEKIYDVIIVGSGPSALTAAIYTTRGNASTLIVGGESWGGQLMLTTVVDNFPGFPEGVHGPDLMLAMRHQAERFGATFLEKNAETVDLDVRPFVVKAGGVEYRSRSVIIATGALTQWLNVPGEKELIGRGVATCAPCDAPFYKNKVVAVVGGGDSAMEEANVLTKYADKVYIIHRRGEFRASKVMQDKIFANHKIEVVWDTEVNKIIGADKVDKIEIENTKTHGIKELSLDGVFVAIGHKPDSDIFKGPVEMDDRGYIKVFDSTKTNIAGVFVAGDVHDDRYKQAITAAGFGCMAAMDVLKYLEDNSSS